MTQNVEIVRAGYEQFVATGDLRVENVAPDFVWDMSRFEGWPEAPIYHGIEGTRAFLRDWTEAWEDWKLELESLEGSGDQVVAIVRQSGRSRATGMAVDMRFAQVWTMRGGQQARMVMYSDPEEGLRAAGLS